jgi:hypothetical protein
MKRIKFNHEETDVLKALGLDNAVEANEILSDETHPDCYKLRFIATLLNGNASSITNVLTMLFLNRPELTNEFSRNIELLLNEFDEEKLKNLDKLTTAFNRENPAITPEEFQEALSDLIEEGKI